MQHPILHPQIHKERIAITPQTHYQTRLNLIDAVSEFFKDGRRDSDLDEDQQKIQRLLTIYRNDTIRRMEDRGGSLDYLFNELKVGVRLAAQLMEQTREEYGDEYLTTWYHGKEPQNFAEGFYNLLSATVLELTVSIVELEEQWPEFKRHFDEDRAAYWQSRTGAESTPARVH